MYITFDEAQEAFAADAAMHEERGVILPDARAYLPESWKRDYTLAMDAQPSLATNANSAVPAIFTTLVDPQVYKVLYAPTKAAKVLGEVRKGTWLDDTALFPTVEYTGEVSSYDDFSENGRTGANANWPQRQSYLFQTNKEYGERELERAGLGRLNWVSELDAAAATILNRYSNLTYLYGVQGLQNYGLLNDPNLSASLTPGTKTAGNGNVWIYNGAPNATANEVYNDILALYEQLVIQTSGILDIDKEAPLKLALSPSSSVALGFINTYGLVVRKMLAEEFPNMTIETVPQYGAQSATNPQGVSGGNFVQMIATEVEGQQTGYCAFNEKMRAHPIVRNSSSFKQKITGGTWGAVIRQPFAISSMLGI